MMNDLTDLLPYLTSREKEELDSLLKVENLPPRPTKIRKHLHILTKDDRLVPYTPNRAQLHFRANRTGRDLVLKARQLGLSTEIQAEAFVLAVTTTSRQATLAHDLKTTQMLRRMANRFYTSLPNTIRPTRGLDNATTTTYPATGSEVSITTAGARQSGRGGTYSHAHGSEVAFWPDASTLMAGLLQGVPAHGRIVLESTPNGAQGWFYEKCMEALDGDSEWTCHFLPWWWAAEYTRALPPDEAATLPASYTGDEQALVAAHGLTAGQIAWRRAKQRELGPLFPQEYAEDPRACFLLSGQGYFTGALMNAFTAAMNAIRQDGQRYVAGLDFGQANDYTVLSVLNASTRQQVALLRINRLPWDDIRARIVDLCKRWGIGMLLAESNSIGQPNIEALHRDLAGTTTRLQAFATTAQTKPQLIQGLYVGLAEGGLKLLPDPAQQREFQAYQAKQTASGHWQYSAPDGEHDDTVIATALAWRAINAGSFILAS